MDKLNKKSSVLVATFSPWKNGKRMPTNGMVEPFIDFFSKRAGHFVLIDQPHPGSDIVLPVIGKYKNNKLIKSEKTTLFTNWLYPILMLQNKSATQISFKLRDFISVFDYVVRNKNKFDIFIGFESVNALSGVILKKLGLINKVVYYVSDFSPKRYKIKWFNKLYLLLDRLAATYSDATWNVSNAMPLARKKLGYDMKKLSPQILSPNAFFKSEIKSIPFKETIPYSLIYAGTLGLENGPDLAIKSMKSIVKKFPKAVLTIAGGGRKEDEKLLKDLINKLDLNENVNFVGFVPTNKELYSLVRKHWISIAPYKAIEESVRWYADAVKIRMSMACGLPVITTHVPPNGKLAQEKGAGIIVKDRESDLAQAVIKVFNNKKLYLKMRNDAITAAKENTWDNSYSNALRQMGLI